MTVVYKEERRERKGERRKVKKRKYGRMERERELEEYRKERRERMGEIREDKEGKQRRMEEKRTKKPTEEGKERQKK